MRVRRRSEGEGVQQVATGMRAAAWQKRAPRDEMNPHVPSEASTSTLMGKVARFSPTMAYPA